MNSCLIIRVTIYVWLRLDEGEIQAHIILLFLLQQLLVFPGWIASSARTCFCIFVFSKKGERRMENGIIEKILQE